MKETTRTFAKRTDAEDNPEIRSDEDAKGESPPEERIIRPQIPHSLDQEAPQAGGDPEDECMKNHCAETWECSLAGTDFCESIAESERAQRVSHANGASVAKQRARERVGEFEGRSPSIERSAPGRTRTCDPRFRKPMLYPAELRARRSNWQLSIAARQRGSRPAASIGHRAQRARSENTIPSTRPPSCLTRSTVARAVPPVASRSSTISTRWPDSIASLCISRLSLPYSRS